MQDCKIEDTVGNLRCKFFSAYRGTFQRGMALGTLASPPAFFLRTRALKPPFGVPRRDVVQ